MNTAEKLRNQLYERMLISDATLMAARVEEYLLGDKRHFSLPARIRISVPPKRKEKEEYASTTPDGKQKNHFAS
jgi:hypothetical protein